MSAGMLKEAVCVFAGSRSTESVWRLRPPASTVSPASSNFALALTVTVARALYPPDLEDVGDIGAQLHLEIELHVLHAVVRDIEVLVNAIGD